MISSGLGQGLTQNLTLAKLPSPRSRLSTFYDGDDTIYIFGGRGERDGLSDILKFTISSEEILLVGNLSVKSEFYANHVSKNSDSLLSIFHNPHEENFLLVTEFNPVTGESKLAANLSNVDLGYANYSPFAQLSNDTVIFLGQIQSSFSTQILEVELSNYTQVYHPDVLTEPMVFSCNAYDGDDEVMYFVAYRLFQDVTYIAKLPLADKKLEIIKEIPDLYYPGGAFWANGKMYIPDSHDEYDAINGIALFNPTDEMMTLVQVDGLLTGTAERGVAYVKRLNRVYLFGGISGDRMYDDVWFIDL